MTATHCQSCGKPLTDFEKRYGLTLCPSCYVQGKSEQAQTQQTAETPPAQRVVEPVIAEQPPVDQSSQYDYEPRRANPLLTIALFPLRLVVAVAAWIVAVWLWLFVTAIIIGIPVVIGLVIYNASPWGSDDNHDSYFNKAGAALQDVTDATDKWNRLADEQSAADTSRLSVDQLKSMVRAQHEAAVAARTAASDALLEMRGIAPPKECQPLHQRTTEALQLTERAFLEAEAYAEGVLRTGQDDPVQYDRVNDLLNESDRAKQEALFEYQKGDCE